MAPVTVAGKPRRTCMPAGPVRRAGTGGRGGRAPRSGRLRRLWGGLRLAAPLRAARHAAGGSWRHHGAVRTWTGWTRPRPARSLRDCRQQGAVLPCRMSPARPPGGRGRGGRAGESRSVGGVWGRSAPRQPRLQRQGEAAENALPRRRLRAACRAGAAGRHVSSRRRAARDQPGPAGSLTPPARRAAPCRARPDANGFVCQARGAKKNPATQLAPSPSPPPPSPAAAGRAGTGVNRPLKYGPCAGGSWARARLPSSSSGS